FNDEHISYHASTIENASGAHNWSKPYQSDDYRLIPNSHRILGWWHHDGGRWFGAPAIHKHARDMRSWFVAHHAWRELVTISKYVGSVSQHFGHDDVASSS